MQEDLFGCTNEFQEMFEMEIKKHTDEAASKVAAVLQRAEEQGRMIESLHTSVSLLQGLILLWIFLLAWSSLLSFLFVTCCR